MPSNPPQRGTNRRNLARGGEIPGQERTVETEPVGSYVSRSSDRAPADETAGGYVQSEIPGETTASDDGEVGHFTDTDPR